MQLIWNKLDNTLSKEEEMKFESLMLNDSSFRSLYQNQLHLHESLFDLPLFQAPSELSANVLSKLEKRYTISPSRLSFPGFYKIALTIAAFVAITMVSVFFGFESESNPGNYEFLDRMVSSMNFKLQLPPELMRYLPYSLVLFAAMILYWFDNLFRGMHSGLRF